MDRNASQTLLAEAALLMTATRVRIARSARLLGKVTRASTRPKTEVRANARQPASTHPPSAPPL